jgi:dehydrogenase/reductase SDR family member 12
VPDTTETITVDRPVADVFIRVADFSDLAEWDPAFDSSRRIDEGPLGVGSSFQVRGSTAGQDLDLVLTITEYDPPRKVVFDGTGEGIDTTERIEVTPTDSGGSEVTYHSAFETERSDLLDAALQVPFWFVGKATIRRLQEWLED